MASRSTVFFSMAVVCALSAVGPLGCADRAWEAALRADAPAAYYRYMRDHPDSPRVADAQERLDFHKLQRNLSLAAFDEFLDEYPDSQLADEVRTQLEPQAFAAARAIGTVEAYEAFTEKYPRGEFVLRAEGNAAYIEAAGFGGRPPELAAFAEQYPESDFASEARRSAAAAALLARSHFDRVGLSIELAPATPEADRLRARFLERAQVTYRRAGVELIPLPEILDPATAAHWPAARLTIAHEEGEVLTSIDDGSLSRPGHVARTRVTLRAAADVPPIFEREFALRVDSVQHVTGTSVLSSTASPRYWESFFVPVATSQTSVLRRPEVALEADVVDVDAVGDRSVVLYEDGRFQIVELADPTRPVVLAEYERPNDFKRWSGVRILDERVALYGEEGIEVVALGAHGPELVLSLPRGQIGTVFALEPMGDDLVVAGARGLLLVDPETGGVKRLMRRVLKGMASLDGTLVLADGESVYVSDLTLLRQKRVHAQLELGKAFDPATVRSFGRRAVVIGGGGIVALDLTRPDKPVVSAKILSTDIGKVYDATAISDRVFLIGDRGLMLMDPAATRVVQWVDVDGKTRMASMGRHVVAVGERTLQAVDAMPLTGAVAPAARGEAPLR